jgi:hypothetical protein
MASNQTSSNMTNKSSKHIDISCTILLCGLITLPLASFISNEFAYVVPLYKFLIRLFIPL